MRPGLAGQFCPAAGKMHAPLCARGRGSVDSLSLRISDVLCILLLRIQPGALRDTAAGDEGPVPQLLVSLQNIDKTSTS